MACFIGSIATKIFGGYLARRKKSDPFLGFIILLAIVLAILGWLKENIIDQIPPGGWAAIVGGMVIITSLKIAGGVSRRRRARAEAEALAQDAERRRIEYLTFGLQKAVSIATHQGWVSPHRLRTQAHVTEKQAQEFLEYASQAGLLQQAVNGRYYLTENVPLLEKK